MTVIVIGGAGVFGSRLVTLLRRDGHDVIVAGRGPVSDLRLDRAGDLTGLIGAAAVVDAAGPFHGYADPYRVARFCIAHGIHYLDLADLAGFCAGIAVLDGDAKAAGVFALSGAVACRGFVPSPWPLWPTGWTQSIPSTERFCPATVRRAGGRWCKASCIRWAVRSRPSSTGGPNSCAVGRARDVLTLAMGCAGRAG